MSQFLLYFNAFWAALGILTGGGVGILGILVLAGYVYGAAGGLGLWIAEGVLKEDAPVEAEATEKIDEKVKNILNIWMERDGSIWINDAPVPMEEVSDIVRPLYAASERHLVISIRGDRETPYSFMDAVQKELVSAGVVRVVFATTLERQMTRARR